MYNKQPSQNALYQRQLRQKRRASIKTWYVYALVDPRDNSMCYVGKTGRLADRLSQHLSSARCGMSSPMHDWLRELIELGLTPIIQIIEETSEQLVYKREAHWIVELLSQGHPVLNVQYNKKALARKLRER